MSLSKDTFDNARKNANKRLEGWINRVKDETEAERSGIPRLQNEFRGVFKKIEWKPRHLRNLERKWMKEHSRDGLFRKTCAESITNVGGGLPGRSSIPWSVQRAALDSNSSNLSSRLEHRDEIIGGKLSGQTTAFGFSRTPVICTPFSQADCDDILEDDTKDDVETAEALDQLGQEKIESKENLALIRAAMDRRGRRGTIIEYDKGFNPLFKRRRRRPPKKESDTTKADTAAQNAEAESDDAGGLFVPVALGNQKSSMLGVDSSVGTIGARPTGSHTSFKVNFKKTLGAPMQVIFRRTAKTGKTLNAFGIKQSVPDIAVSTREPVTSEQNAAIMAKFRRVIRLLIHVRVLLNVSRLRIEEEEKSKAFKRLDGDCELSFDPAMFKTAFAYGGLTERIRRALKKNPNDRNEEDARTLMEVMLRMPVFIKYSKRVKQWLAKQMWYDCFHNGRVIVKQGDPGSRMYFVVSGEVYLQRTDTLETGEINSYHLKTLSAGATFGEIALIRDMKREFTAICKGTSEFLSLSKSEFNNALRHRWEQECNTRLSFLSSCKTFATWTDKQRQHCADASEIKEYNDNKVILGDIDRPTENIYFIRKGRCEVVRRIAVFRHQSPYRRPELHLSDTEKRRREIAEKSYCKSRRIYKKEVHFLTVTTLHRGNYFGAGESLRDTFILSRGKTECVLVNSAQFSIQGKSEQLRNLAAGRERALPSNQELYRQYQANRRWYEYRNSVLKEVYGAKKMGGAERSAYKDVPRTILNEPRIPDDLINYN